MTDVAARPDAPTPARDEVFLVDPSIRARRRENVLVAVVRVAIAAVGLLAWEFASGRWISEFWISSPTAVWWALLRFVESGQLLPAVRATVVETAAGFAVGAVAGIVVGLLFGISPLVARILDPYFVALNSVPRVALIPLFILWFGFGVTAKVLVAAIFAYFPVAAATIVGVRSVSPLHRDLAFTVGASRRHRLVLVDLPSALPSILTGMEVAIVLATVGAVVAEYLAGSEGLGWLAVTSLNQLQVDTLFGVIVLMSILGFTLYKLVAGLRRLLVPWHPSGRDEPVTTAW